MLSSLTIVMPGILVLAISCILSFIFGISMGMTVLQKDAIKAGVADWGLIKTEKLNSNGKLNRN